MARLKKSPYDPFRWFDSSPKVIRLVVMMDVRYPLSLRNVADLLFERGIDICHETVLLWWTRFGPMFAEEIRCKRVQHMRQFTHWRWHLDEVYVKINGEMRYIWRDVEMHQESTQAPRPSAGHRRRRPALLRRDPKRDRPRRSPGAGGLLDQQSR